MLSIRGSSTTTYEACPRLWAAQKILEEGDSYQISAQKLARPLLHVGAVVGRGLHAGAAYLMKEFERSGAKSIKRKKEAIDVARESVVKDYDGGVRPDAVTPTSRDAMLSSASLVDRLDRDFDPKDQMTIIEAGLRMVIDVDDGSQVMVTGTVDHYVVLDTLTDFKTGKAKPAPIAQIGTYSLLTRHAGYTPKSLQMLYGRRVRMDAWQPPYQRTWYDRIEAERHALSIIFDAARAWYRWLITRDPREFKANPTCRLCSEAYCPAYNSDFCKIGKQAHG